MIFLLNIWNDILSCSSLFYHEHCSSDENFVCGESSVGPLHVMVLLLFKRNHLDCRCKLCLSLLPLDERLCGHRAIFVGCSMPSRSIEKLCWKACGIQDNNREKPKHKQCFAGICGRWDAQAIFNAHKCNCSLVYSKAKRKHNVKVHRVNR